MPFSVTCESTGHDSAQGLARRERGWQKLEGIWESSSSRPPAPPRAMPRLFVGLLLLAASAANAFVLPPTAPAAALAPSADSSVDARAATCVAIFGGRGSTPAKPVKPPTANGPANWAKFGIDARAKPVLVLAAVVWAVAGSLAK